VTGKRRSDRRAAILEATLRLIGDRGADAVTHRAVAAEAGVPLASTTYYFDSKDALVQEAFELAVERSTGLLERTLGAAAGSPAELVDRLVELSLAQLAGEDAPLAAQYELLLEAGRRPELQPAARSWSDSYREAISRAVAGAGLSDPERTAGGLIAALEGALLAELSTPSEDPRARLRTALEPLVGAATAPPEPLFTGLAPVLNVRDPAAERAFYIALGLPVTYEGPEYPGFYAFGEPPVNFGIQQAERPNDPASVLTWQITVSDVDLVAERCRSAGIPFVLEYETPAPGWRYRRLVAETPSGYRLALEGPREG
jgi:DNA-binding transcriptional regulator YbjK/catechol 2,3-dioxygenase-like lactoylglutathione lyase family enzyme